jgi:DNA repair protein RecO (recombination protein O)
MLFKTRGIVFHHLDYSESSVIVKIYTEAFGLESYLLKGAKRVSKVSKVRKVNKVNAGLLQHLSLVDLVVYHNEKGGLQHIQEIKSNYRFNTIPFDIRKSSVLLFMNEMLYKSIREPGAVSRELFEYIHDSVIRLDKETGSISDFHIHFIIHLTRYLGFYPQNNYSERNNFFNLREGVFQEWRMENGEWRMENFLTENLSKQLSAVLSHPINNTPLTPLKRGISQEGNKESDYTIPHEYRKELLDKIIEYYQYHISGLNEINSHSVLEAVFN